MNIFDEVYLFPKDGILKKINFIYKLTKKKFDYIFVFDGKDRSIITSIFIRSKYKISIVAKERLNLLWKLLRVKFVNDDEKTDILKIFQEAINRCNINLIISDFNFLTKRRNNEFSSGISIKNYLHIHLDEKWIKNFYIETYKDIVPSYEEFAEFLNFLVKSDNILITTGLVDFKLIQDLKDKFFVKQSDKIYHKKDITNSIYFVYKPTFYDLESLLRHSKLLVACHGAITHAANSLGVKIVDIIDESKKKFYTRFTSYLSKYSHVYRDKFNLLKVNLVNKIKE